MTDHVNTDWLFCQQTDGRHQLIPGKAKHVETTFSPKAIDRVWETMR